MKRYLYLLLLLFLSVDAWSQRSAEYNQRGDDAMKRKDFTDAKMWYEEGVSQCDSYSINQLTQLWLNQPVIRSSMRSLMDKCMNCLNVKAMENDTAAMSQLILYYSEGIGIPKNSELAESWIAQKKKITETPKSDQTSNIEYRDTLVTQVVAEKEHQRWRPFLGYAFSLEAPYGITVGLMGKSIGFYVRMKTNMNFRSNAYECNDNGDIVNFSNLDNYSYAATGEKSTNAFAVTGGIVAKCASWLYLSAGAGYGKRDLLYSFKTNSYDNYDNQTDIWCKNIDSSSKGVVVEGDVMLRFGSFFLSGGCTTVNFKYVDLNMGAGVFF